VCLSLPRVLGADGIETTLRPALDASERAAIDRSVRALQDAAARISVWGRTEHRNERG
jgi:L-lactate dehydrogenase